jgi:hypothetical protein
VQLIRQLLARRTTLLRLARNICHHVSSKMCDLDGRKDVAEFVDDVRFNSFDSDIVYETFESDLWRQDKLS